MTSEQPGAAPLVVEPEHEDAQPLNWEGASVASSWSDLDAALRAEHVDPAEVLFTAAGAGLDTLGAVVSPLDTLLEGGVGWLIEHVWFLHEPLDALAGDPTQITAQASTWHRVGTELGAIAQDHRRAAAALGAWEGPAGDGYRGAVDRFGGALEQSGRDAARLADLILTTGAHVGTVRAIVRDMIAEWVGKAIQTAVFAGVAALITAGGALGVAALRLITSAVDLAAAIGRLIRRLLNSLTLAGGMAAQVSGAIQQTATAVHAAMPTLQQVHQAADDFGVGRAVENGKQLTKAEQEQRTWGPAPA